MGLFSGITKAVKGIGKTISKTVSLKNAVKVVTGGGADVLKDAGKTLISQVTASKASTAKPNTTSKKGLSGNDYIDAAIGGGLAAVGVKIAGTDEGNAAINATGWSAAKQWLKNNWYWVVGGVAVVATTVWAVFFRKPKTGARKSSVRTVRR